MITHGTARQIVANFFGVLLLTQNGAFAGQPTAHDPDSAPILTAAQVEKVLGQPHVGYQAHYDAGRFFESKGLVDQAIDHYKQAIADKGVQASAYKHLAQLCLTSKDAKTTDSVVADGLKRFPDDYGMHLTAGFVYHNEHKLPEALAMYKKAISISPKNPDIYLATADVLSDMSKGKEALDMVNHSMSLAKPATLAYYEQAKALMALGKINEALVPLKRNFTENPLNYKNGQIYSALLQKQGKNAEGLEVSLCLLAGVSGVSMEETKTMVTGFLSSLSPEVVKVTIKKAEDRIADKNSKAIIHFALGDVYDRATRRDDAMAQYKAGLALNPSFARGYLRLGEDLEANKDLRGASQNYDKAFALDRNDSEIVSRREKLNSKQTSSKTK